MGSIEKLVQPSDYSGGFCYLCIKLGRISRCGSLRKLEPPGNRGVPKHLNRPAQDAKLCIRTMYYSSLEGNTLIITNSINLRYTINYGGPTEYLIEKGVLAAAQSILDGRDSDELMNPFDLSMIIIGINDKTGIFGTRPCCDKHNYRIWLGEQIHQKRRENAVDESEMAEAVGISTKTLKKIEEGRYAADIDLLQRIAEVLHCNLALLAK